MKIRKVEPSVGVLGKILNIFSSSNKDTYSCDYVNGLAGKILWTNPNPTIAFEPQIIILSESLANYDCYEIIYLNTTSEDRYYNTGKIPKGHGTGIFDVYSSSGTYGVGCRSREIIYAGNTQLKIREGKFSAGSSSQTINNNICIPICVIAYKTKLFN